MEGGGDWSDGSGVLAQETVSPVAVSQSPRVRVHWHV